MAKSKVEKWLTPEGLTLLAGWARDGLTDEQIANNCGIRRSTLFEWKKKYSDISDTLKKNKEIVDYEVENALYKKTLGYNVPVLKNVKVKRIDYDEKGHKTKEYEELIEVYDEVHVPADTTAQIFWLKNRKPNQWREKPVESKINENENDINSFVDALNNKASEVWSELDEEN